MSTKTEVRIFIIALVVFAVLDMLGLVGCARYQVKPDGTAVSATTAAAAPSPVSTVTRPVAPMTDEDLWALGLKTVPGTIFTANGVECVYESALGYSKHTAHVIAQARAEARLTHCWAMVSSSQDPYGIIHPPRHTMTDGELMRSGTTAATNTASCEKPGPTHTITEYTKYRHIHRAEVIICEKS